MNSEQRDRGSELYVKLIEQYQKLGREAKEPYKDGEPFKSGDRETHEIEQLEKIVGLNYEVLENLGMFSTDELLRLEQCHFRYVGIIRLNKEIHYFRNKSSSREVGR